MKAAISAADLGGFSQAARDAGVTPAAVSKMVARLEDHLGVRLFQRTTRSLTPTSEGEVFLARARGFLEDFDELVEETRGGGLAMAGAIRMTAPASFTADWFAPFLPEFLKEHPDIRLEVDLTDRKADLVAEGFDLALRIGPLDDSSYALRRVARVRTLLCASPRYLSTAAAITTPSELNDHACIVDRNAREGARWSATKDAVTEKVVIRPRIETNGASCVRLAEAGLGVVREPEFLVSAGLESGKLVRVLEDWDFGEAPVSLLFPSNRRIPHRVRALSDWIAKLYRRPAWETA